MYFFILVYIVLVLIRPQDYPQWAGLGIPFQPIALVLAFLFWLPARDKDLSAPQNLLLPLFLVAQMVSHIVNGTLTQYPDGSMLATPSGTSLIAPSRFSTPARPTTHTAGMCCWSTELSLVLNTARYSPIWRPAATRAR